MVKLTKESSAFIQVDVENKQVVLVDAQCDISSIICTGQIIKIALGHAALLQSSGLLPGFCPSHA